MSRHHTSITVACTAVVCALVAFSPHTSAQEGTAPNILYIVADDLGWSDTGFTGSRYYETPHLDRLAKGGVVFTQAYAPAANCAPSRACCMSGQYTPRHGVYTVGNSDRGNAAHRKLIPTANTRFLSEENLTIAEALKAGGYTTCFIGKWHLGKDASSQGFDVNIAGSSHGHPSSYFSPYRNQFLPDGPAGEYLTDRLTSEAIRFLEMRSHDKPFFMNLSFYTPHGPWQAKSETVKRFEAKPGSRQHDHAAYAAMIKHLDDNLGRLLDALRTYDVLDNTLIVFTSDNGGVYFISRQWPLRAGKGSYYEGGIRVPMVVHWPGRTTPGRACDVPVSGIDLYPTFLEASGVTPPGDKQLDGVSLLPLIRGNGTIEERPLFWHFPIYLQNNGNTETQDLLFRTRPGSAVRSGDWKLIEYFEDDDLELYHLKDDLGEKRNLARQLPEKARELRDQLRRWRRRTNAPVPTKRNPKYDAAAEQEAMLSARQSL